MNEDKVNIIIPGLSNQPTLEERNNYRLSQYTAEVDPTELGTLSGIIPISPIASVAGGFEQDVIDLSKLDSDVVRPLEVTEDISNAPRAMSIPKKKRKTRTFQTSIQEEENPSRTGSFSNPLTPEPQQISEKEFLNIGLIDACKKGDIKVVKNLLSRGADPHTENALGWTPLHSAAGSKSVAIVDLLIHQYNCDPNAINRAGHNMLHKSAREGNVDICRFLVDKIKMEIETIDGSGYTPLFYAAFSGNLDCLNLFLDKGSNVFHKTSSGDSLLHVAIKSKSLSIVERVVKYTMSLPVSEEEIFNSFSDYNQVLKSPMVIAIELDLVTIIGYLLGGVPGITVTKKDLFQCKSEKALYLLTINSGISLTTKEREKILFTETDTETNFKLTTKEEKKSCCIIL